MGEQAAALRRIIEEPGLVPLVGAYDVLSARLAEQSGFAAIHVGGYNLSASRLGMPDVGFLTMTENLDALRAITARVSIPVLADGDDGYGNHLNVTRLVRELELAGVAGMHIEDQVFPKRCGHMEGKRVIPREDMVAKIMAAVDARQDANFVVVARTDAAAVTGFDDALERAAAYAEAGADVLFVEAPEQEEQVAAIARSIGKPLLYNWCFGGKSPDVAPARLAAMGFKFLLLTDVLFAVAHTLRDLYAEVRQTGTYAGFAPRMVPFTEFNRMVGMNEVEALDQRFRR